MSDEKRRTERERREVALASAGTGVEPGAREVPGRELRQVLSVRMEPELIRDLREVADSAGVKVSDVLRATAAQLVHEYRKQQVRVTLFPTGPAAVVTPRLTWGYWDGERTHQVGGLVSATAGVQSRASA